MPARHGSHLCAEHELGAIAAAWLRVWEALEALARASMLPNTIPARLTVARLANELERRMIGLPEHPELPRRGTVRLDCLERWERLHGGRS